MFHYEEKSAHVHEPSYRASFFEMKAFEIREKPAERPHERPKNPIAALKRKHFGFDTSVFCRVRALIAGRNHVYRLQDRIDSVPAAQIPQALKNLVKVKQLLEGAGDQPRRAHSGTATYLQPGGIRAADQPFGKESEGTDGFSRRKNLF